MRDYSSRSGYPMGEDAVRGIAMKDFTTPREYRTSNPVRPQSGPLH